MGRTKKIIFLLIFLSGALILKSGQVGILKEDASVTKKILDNGLVVIVKENHATPIVAVDVWVGMGSINEEENVSGLSHFFEHMLFKGTKKRGVGEIDLEIDSIGGINNAATSKDYTHYYVVAASEYFGTALDVTSDAIINSVFDEGEIEKERLVVQEEKRRALDNPTRNIFDLLFQTAYKVHPYNRTVLGSMESISNIKREDFFNYHEKYYVPNNIVVVVVGDVDAREAISKIEDAFSDLQPVELPVSNFPKEPMQKEVRRVTLEKDVEQVYLGIAFHGPGIESRDVYALDVIAALLGKGRSSRLYQYLKEERQLVNSINAFFLTQKEPSLFIITSTLKEENLEETEEEIINELQKIIKEPVTEEELDKAKKQLVTEYAFDMETNQQQAGMLGYFQTIAGDYTLALTYPEDIMEVGSEDIMRVAQRYFGRENYSIAIIKPGGG